MRSTRVRASRPAACRKLRTRPDPSSSLCFKMQARASDSPSSSACATCWMPRSRCSRSSRAPRSGSDFPANIRPEVSCTGRLRAYSTKKTALTSVFAMTSFAALPAAAQRTDANAVAAAADAFGVTVGFQTIGLYGPTSVRGFNPAQAENLRIEGLYYDQQISYSNPFLFSRSDIRVGIAAQSYGFPSPTGIVDYKLRTPGDAAHLSVLLTRGPLDMATAEIDGQYPLVPDVLSAGVSLVHWSNFDYNYARTSESQGFSMLLRIRPNERSQI